MGSSVATHIYQEWRSVYFLRKCDNSSSLHVATIIKNQMFIDTAVDMLLNLSTGIAYNIAGNDVSDIKVTMVK